MKRAIIGLCLLACACTDDAGAINAAENIGLTHVVPQGYSWTGCGGDDHYHTAFVAKRADGHSVYGVVCCGLFLKGCTVRF